ncbi:MAG: SPFH domain-containing protein [Clostridiales Family XIII bacterium]|jgi:regulator of protease activity HflC (stomatin/prohibitin superfamily)|nr:SPFH domain-containing protein [Clostridiales Family XIII bacterium]
METNNTAATAIQNEISQTEEKKAPAAPGMPLLILAIVLAALSVFALVKGASIMNANAFARTDAVSSQTGAVLIAVFCVIWAFICFIMPGLRILKPNEAFVLTIFGKYYGSLKGAGFYFVNPFAVATGPRGQEQAIAAQKRAAWQIAAGASGAQQQKTQPVSRKISLKAMTLNNEKQKINDLMGNPIEIGIVVIWRVVNTAKAVFSVDDYEAFLSTQCDSALRNIVRLYPYDVPGEEDELSLRGSSQEISEKLKAAIQEKLDVAGIEIMEARITHLAYSPEIAAAMLQRQQASAIVDARTLIVKGAVGMVEQALRELSDNGIVDLDEERKAAMVSNLLVVLCGNKDAQPIVNSGSLY